MPTAPSFQALATAAARAGGLPQRRVVDAPTRLFHWLFALSFIGAYLTAEGERWRALHVTLGYTLAGLLAFRLVYGLFGPRHARLGMLLRKLASAPAWVRSAAQGLKAGQWQGINGRQGQNLLMALAVVAMLLLVAPLTLSGYGSYNDWGHSLGGDWLEEAHEFFGNTFMAVVLVHVGLIIALSLLRRRNQALPMLTGRTDGAGPDLVKRNHTGLAGLLLAGVVAFLSWQWQQSPQGLVPTGGLTGQAFDRDHEDDD